MLCIKEIEESLFKLSDLYFFNANLFLIKESQCSTGVKSGE